MICRYPVVETGRYVQKRRGHYTMGCPSGGEENPDQTVSPSIPAGEKGLWTYWTVRQFSTLEKYPPVCFPAKVPRAWESSCWNWGVHRPPQWAAKWWDGQRQCTGKAECQPLAVQPRGGLVRPCIALGGQGGRGKYSSLQGVHTWSCPPLSYWPSFRSRVKGRALQRLTGLYLWEKPMQDSNGGMLLSWGRPRQSSRGGQRGTRHAHTLGLCNNLCVGASALKNLGIPPLLGVIDVGHSIAIMFWSQATEDGQGIPPLVCSGLMWGAGLEAGKPLREPGDKKKITKDAPGKVSFWTGVGEAEWVSVALTPESSLTSLSPGYVACGVYEVTSIIGLLSVLRSVRCNF